MSADNRGILNASCEILPVYILAKFDTS